MPTPSEADQWLEPIKRRSHAFGIPFSVLTADHVNNVFDPGGLERSAQIATVIERYEYYLEEKFGHLEFFRAPHIINMHLVMQMSGEKPFANPLYHVNDIQRALKGSDSISPIGIVVHPPGDHHTGHHFLSQFTRAPHSWLATFPAAEKNWFLMQTAHELGHANGGDEVMADACGALAFVELTGQPDFLMQWYKARVCKWLFNPEGHDLTCAKVIEKIHDNIERGWKPGCSMTSRQLLDVARDIKADTQFDQALHAEFKEQFLSELKTGVPIEAFIEKHIRDFTALEPVMTLMRCCYAGNADPFGEPARYDRGNAVAADRFPFGS